MAVLAVSTRKPGKILLVTSRHSRSWSLAKGNVDGAMTAVEAARREAFEEAGVVGRISSAPIGSYTHRKSLGGIFRVRVFKLHVRAVLAKWPEKKERRRRWMPVEEALKLVSNPGLRRLIKTHVK